MQSSFLEHCCPVVEISTVLVLRLLLYDTSVEADVAEAMLS